MGGIQERGKGSHTVVMQIHREQYDFTAHPVSARPISESASGGCCDLGSKRHAHRPGSGGDINSANHIAMRTIETSVGLQAVSLNCCRL